MRGLNRTKIGVIGLGYVGLPLAVEFGKKYRTVGFDINLARIKELKAGHDSTLEATTAELKSAKKLKFSARLTDLKTCKVFIVTVPTPIDQYKRPDLTPLLKASETAPLAGVAAAEAMGARVAAALLAAGGQGYLPPASE